MKKIVSLIVLCIGLALIAAGCSSKDKDTKNSEENEPTPTPITSGQDDESFEPVYNTKVREEYKLEDYIKLGKYKGVEVNIEKREVTDEDVYLEMQLDMRNNGAELTEVKDRPVQLGDTVNIDYQGLKNGVAFEGGTDTGYDLMIGSNAFIEGFEEQIIGAKTGDKIDLNVTFPEQYPAADLAGEAVIFKVTVNKIQQYVATETYLKDNTEYDSEEAYKEAIRQQLVLENEEAVKNEKQKKAYNAVVDGCEFIKHPKTLLEFYAEDLRVFYTNYAAAYSMDLNTFLQASGVTMEQYESDEKKYAENMATRELVMKAIIAAEGITLSEEEFQKGAEEYAHEYGYESVQDFLAGAEEELLREDLIFQKVLDLIVAEAIFS